MPRCSNKLIPKLYLLEHVKQIDTNLWMFGVVCFFPMIPIELLGLNFAVKYWQKKCQSLSSGMIQVHQNTKTWSKREHMKQRRSTYTV